MTKYVIQSGGFRSYPEKMQAYFRELLDIGKPEVSVLWCYFASKPEDFLRVHKNYQEIFNDNLPANILIHGVVATVENFVEQVVAADVVYFNGGDNGLFRKHTEIHDLAKLLEGKSVGTNSASTLLLASAGWSCDSRTCIDGYGIWPAKVLVHYRSPKYGTNDPRGPIDWDAAKAELEAYGDTSLPVYALKEGEFVVFEV